MVDLVVADGRALEINELQAPCFGFALSSSLD
jgi:hypothetical protein